MDNIINKKFSDVLFEGEEIKVSFGTGKVYIRVQRNILLGSIIMITLFGLLLSFWSFFIGLALFILAFLYAKYYLPIANIYAFTNKRVLVHRGIFSSFSQSVEYKNITDIAVSQGYFDKKQYHTGNILINTAGHIRNQIGLVNIENPYEIKKKLDQLISLNK
jgi:membrane protein YdbS with pleckstrin-like domain